MEAVRHWILGLEILLWGEDSLWLGPVLLRVQGRKKRTIPHRVVPHRLCLRECARQADYHWQNKRQKYHHHPSWQPRPSGGRRVCDSSLALSKVAMRLLLPPLAVYNWRKIPITLIWPSVGDLSAN